MDRRIESLIDDRHTTQQVLRTFEDLRSEGLLGSHPLQDVFLENLRRRIKSYDMLIGQLIEIQGPQVFDD